MTSFGISLILFAAGGRCVVYSTLSNEHHFPCFYPWAPRTGYRPWVIPDILQNSMPALVTTRLKYMAEHECERRGYPDMPELEETDELNKNAER